jgi:hypothetical protein
VKTKKEAKAITDGRSGITLTTYWPVAVNDKDPTNPPTSDARNEDCSTFAVASIQELGTTAEGKGKYCELDKVSDNRNVQEVEILLCVQFLISDEDSRRSETMIKLEATKSKE